ncbi:MAG: glucose-6-phosphate isomerase, partial [Planctomycetes bacterium]|nr:glucose-6-phosphate isomerase [Planctomycetota bacterium]
RGRLFDVASALGCEDGFSMPEGADGLFSILSPACLLPAAVLGLDVVRLLEGASAMNDHFRSAPPGRNATLDFVGVGHLMECKRRARIRVLHIGPTALKSVGNWYGHLRAASLAEGEPVASSLTGTDAHDSYSDAPQRSDGRRHPLVTKLILDHGRCDPWCVGWSEGNEDGLNALADRTLPDLAMAAIRSRSESFRNERRPADDIHMPQLNEYTLGQLLQMLMIATAVEDRLTETMTD